MPLNTMITMNDPFVVKFDDFIITILIFFLNVL